MRPVARHAQRGMGTVAASVVLLLALALAVFYFNRHLLFEQRTAINQVRAMQAQALAQSGVQWALLRLNDQAPLSAVCATSLTARARELAWSDTGLHAACAVDDDGAWSCACGTATPAAWPAQATQGFAVQLQRHSDDARSVQVRATGCVRAAAPCVAGDGQAQARWQAAAAPQALLWRRPVAPLTASGDIQVCQPATLTNTDSGTPGWWAHAGGAATVCSATPAALHTVAGSVVAAHGGDATLSALTQADAFFANWFGTSVSSYRAIACRPSGATAGARGADLLRLWGEGCRRFFAEADIEIDAGSVLGTDDDPIALVAQGTLTFRGAAALHGVIVGHAVQWGGLRLRGAALVRGNVSLDSAASLHYDDAVLQRLSERAAAMVALPGSWRDE